MEIDAKDLPDLAYYKDEKCRVIQDLLHTDSRYAEFVITRQRYSEDPKFDPIIIQDLEGNNLLWLENWEIDALNESELLSYIIVQFERENLSDRIQLAAFLVLSLCIAPFLFISLIYIYPIYHDFVNPILALVDLLLLIPVLVSGVVLLWRRGVIRSKKRNIDVEAARVDSAFLEALRKLAEIQSADYIYNEEHVKRLEETERILSGYDV